MDNSEIVFKKSDGKIFVRGCANEVGDIPAFKEVSRRSGVPSEVIEKVNEVYELLLEFQVQGDFNEFTTKDGTRYRIFKNDD